MDKWFKFLRKRSKKEQHILIEAVGLIMHQKLKGLDIKKLKGCNNIFRVRLQKFRIIFEKNKTENTIIKVDERDDQTYKI